ncbi:metal ABC transporter substrate-binding protein [Vallicoccus soli]|uniref:Zinc ABC transporter substrate-binding protein n=1 Tax=Vallicoccus soli TaxID=2339232 RepID=A0A3A3ZLE6_9ACTN|nr:metal ABC transporter substrate-binding protein [Vallicoccus soli]RJK97026.1 zinc ABC transporter substrate-binding protein [Vallicoccus soli]
MFKLRPAAGATALALLATSALAACGDDAGGSASAGSGDGGLAVVASFYPLEYVAGRVGGDAVEVRGLTAPGAEPHDLELTAREVGALSEADLVVYLHGFQPSVDEAVQEQAADSSLDVEGAARLDLAASEEEHDHAHEGEEHADEHAHDAEEHAAEEHAAEEHAAEEHAAEEHATGGEEPAEEHAGHEHEGADPHFWLDPTRLADVGDALAERLAQEDPDGAAGYEERAAALRADLEELDAQMREGLADCRVDTLVTSHTAFGYLADRYGFEQVGLTGVSPEAEPTAAGIAELVDLVRERGVTTVYSEVLVSPQTAETVAREAGVETAVLDPLEGITDDSAGEDYLAVMRANLEALRSGQSCA